MNTLKTKFISLGLVVIFLSSCTNLLYTSLDVLRPAKVAFDADAHNLLLVNNTVVQPVEYGHRITSYNVCYTKLLRISLCWVQHILRRFVAGKNKAI